MQFAFRWMNCLLMREISVKCTVRMWDTYLVSLVYVLSSKPYQSFWYRELISAGRRHRRIFSVSPLRLFSTAREVLGPTTRNGLPGEPSLSSLRPTLWGKTSRMT